MSLSKTLGGHRDSFTKQGRFLQTAESVALEINQELVHVTGWAGAVTITLPSVSEAVNRTIAIKVIGDSDTNNITIQDKDDSHGWTDLTADSVNDGSVLLFSDGEQWHVIASTVIS